MNVYERILAYVRDTAPGQRKFHLSEDDMYQLLSMSGDPQDREAPSQAELDKLFPDHP